MFGLFGSLKDIVPVIEQLTRLPGQAVARIGLVLQLLLLISGGALVRRSGSFLGYIVLIGGLLFGVATALFAWRRRRLEKAVDKWVMDRMRTMVGDTGQVRLDYSETYQGHNPAESHGVILNQDGTTFTSSRPTDTSEGRTYSHVDTADAAQQRQLRHDAMLEAQDLRDTWLPRVEAAQRSAVAAVGGLVNAPYLKDDLRITLVSGLVAVIGLPLGFFLLILAAFALL
ncbi:hypothetical protein [Actinobaculum sp. 352]|uniref:hypothetical protein n=1 Tax=Actinobaculum sp. 352 TaxID=2490946 RepID=UPI000F7F8BD8|nr:hypothetical protein [Actinobaculum sp. 352]RTE50859.1 hypothetical protein EKN07_01645 [Actinobaculum sp. 352]